MNILKPISVCVLAAAVLTACDQREKPVQPVVSSDAPAMSEPAVPVASAAETMSPGASAQVTMMSVQGRAIAGQLTASQQADGVRFVGRIEGLEPSGEHGFHVHEVGDCSAADFASAGAHFNPEDVAHGSPQHAPHHAGDLPNLRADSQGIVNVDVSVDGLTLGGGALTDISGRAVLVHALPDDYTSQPSGASGDRIACGVIGSNGQDAGK